MSKRGDIVVDSRTNTLIIREIPTYLPAVLQLIDNLDTRDPAGDDRVADRRDDEVASAAVSASTGDSTARSRRRPRKHDRFDLPELRSAPTFRVGLDAGPTVALHSAGNILDSFNLDVALTAAENQGLLKIISSPKVAALTNTAASIQSGIADSGSDQRQQHDDGHLRGRDAAS